MTEPTVPSPTDILAESAEQYRSLLSSVDLAFCIISVLFDADGVPFDYRFVDANPAFERHTGLVDAVGKTIRELVPEIDESWFPIYGGVAQTGTPVRFENHDPALRRWFDAYASRVGSPELRRVGIMFADITARKEAESRLREAQARLEAAVSAGNIATWTIDLVNDRVTGDAYLAHLFSVDLEATLKGTEPTQTYFNAIHQEDRARTREAIDHSIATGTPYIVDLRVVLADGSTRSVSSRGKVVHDDNGKPTTMFGAVIDLTERKRAEEREQARLTDIFERAPAFMASLRGPQHVFELANPPYYQLVGHREILGKTVAEALPEVVEQGFINLLDRVYETGEAFVGTDVPITLQSERNGPLEPRYIDFTYQPLHGEDGKVTGILAHGIDLTVRKRLEQEREALLSATRVRAEHEALLNQIGASVRGSLEPDAILRAAVTTLGQGLGVDRCYFVRYNQTRDIARVSPEWLREGANIASIADRNLRMSTFSVDRDDSYRAGTTHAVADVVTFAPEDATPLLELDIRALLRVPMEVGDQMTALAVSMAFAPRAWTDDEVRLLENVATLLHTVLESALVTQRERNIAERLQEALQPATPDSLPGLSLASFYRSALSEARVGGDFFDVFSISEGCTALVVADLSGKGLAAASQVSIVRNMLRYSLYSAPTIAAAVTGLHRALVEHELLSGFATLFLGVYDDREQVLTYVNCGQEPGLIYRPAADRIDLLLPTGPVLGGFGAGDYTETVVALAPGDVLAMFTDGLTEVGPSRKQQLEIEGVSRVLRECCARESTPHIAPESVVDCLIAGVDDFAQGGVRDDIALLVGVVTKTPTSREDGHRPRS